MLIFSCSYVFWLGDLNFRINENVHTTPEEVVDLVKKDKLQELINHDQLKQVREQGKAFMEFSEKLPQFPPTFKFEEGTNTYDLK